MNELALVQKVWNYAHVLRDQAVPYQAYISQISYLLFLKMDDERAGLVASGVKANVLFFDKKRVSAEPNTKQLVDLRSAHEPALHVEGAADDARRSR